MATQLIYTSSPQGLTHGRTGFCTVARSLSMPEKLAAAVEKCGVYERLQSGASPVAYSLRCVKFGAENFRVLTRACDCGSDYTNRNNFIAHHLVLADSEIREETPNPAEIMLNWDGWLSAWSAAPHYIERDVDVSKISRIENLLPAKTWAEVFGDAGKAALLVAESPAALIAKCGQEELILRLFAESLALNTDRKKAWTASFTTYSLENPGAPDVLWKTYIDAPPADLKPAAINVSAKCAPAIEECRAAQYARSGLMTNREKYKLKVEHFKTPEKKFQVVEVKKSGFGTARAALYAAGAALAVFAAAAVIYALSEGNAAQTQSAQSEVQTSLNSAPPPIPQTTAMSFTEMRAQVKDLIEAFEFDEAFVAWKDSRFAELDPGYGQKILSDIGEKFDAMLAEASEALKAYANSASKEDLVKARALCNNAESALKLDKLPRLESRRAALENLKEKLSSK